MLLMNIVIFWRNVAVLMMSAVILLMNIAMLVKTIATFRVTTDKVVIKGELIIAP